MVTHSEKVASHSSRIIKILDGKIIEDISNKCINEIAATKDINQANGITDSNNKKNLSFF